MANETVDTEENQLTDDAVWTIGEDGERVPNYEATFPEIVDIACRTRSLYPRSRQGHRCSPVSVELRRRFPSTSTSTSAFVRPSLR